MRILIFSFIVLIFSVSANCEEFSKEDLARHELSKEIFAAFEYVEPFHPIRGQFYGWIREEASAWIKFLGEFGAMPLPYIYGYCKKWYDLPSRTWPISDDLIMKGCMEWGWVPPGKSGKKIFDEDEYYKYKLIGLKHAVFDSTIFSPAVNFKFSSQKQRDDEYNRIYALEGLSPKDLVHKKCTQFFSIRKAIQATETIPSIENRLLSSCKIWNWELRQIKFR